MKETRDRRRARPVVEAREAPLAEPPVLGPAAREPRLENLLPLMRLKLEGGDDWKKARRYLVSQGLAPDKAEAIIADMRRRCLGRSRPKAILELIGALALGAVAIWAAAPGGRAYYGAALFGLPAFFLFIAGLLRLGSGGLSEVTDRWNPWRLTPRGHSFLGELYDRDRRRRRSL